MITPRTSWTLFGTAVALFAFIFFFERHFEKEVPGPAPVMPGLSPAEVEMVQVIPSDGTEIRAERTNGSWRLTRPLDYPANDAAVDALLKVLSQLKPQAHISADELNQRPEADKEFGLDTPQLTLIVSQQGHRTQIQIGKVTVMGDQLFLRVVGTEGISIVTSQLLTIIPTLADHWRDTAFFTIGDVEYSRLTITNGNKIIEFEKAPGTRAWRMTRPLPARADQARIETLLQDLRETRVEAFVNDEPDPDLADYNLKPPDLTLALGGPSNTVALFQFGRNPTNEAAGFFVRRERRPGVVLAPAEAVRPWLATYNDFRDRHLASITPGSVDTVEISGADDFILKRQTNNSWLVSGASEFEAEPALIRELFLTLNDLTVAGFEKDVVTELDLPTYGLERPTRQFILKAAGTNDTPGPVIAHIEFGAVSENRIFARRADESPVYAVKLTDFSRLPAESWQFRQYQLWDFAPGDVSRLIVSEGGGTQELVHDGPHQWSLAPGSQGVINDLAIEEVVAALGRLSASAWVAKGEANRPRFGFSDPPSRIEVELKKNGETRRLAVEFGGINEASQFPYAGTTVDDDYLIFEFPWKLYQELRLYVFPPVTPAN